MLITLSHFMLRDSHQCERQPPVAHEAVVVICSHLVEQDEARPIGVLSASLLEELLCYFARVEDNGGSAEESCKDDVAYDTREYGAYCGGARRGALTVLPTPFCELLRLIFHRELVDVAQQWKRGRARRIKVLGIPCVADVCAEKDNGEDEECRERGCGE